MYQERINQYECDTCIGHITTVDRDEGTTPFFLVCRATAGCDGRMHSAMYVVAQDLTPEFEWYKPTGKELRKLSPEVRQHVEMGGLLIRKIAIPVG